MTRKPKEKQYTPNILLRKERERRNWTHAEVANQIGLPDSHSVGRWERGEVFPGSHYRRKLCRIFGKNMDELGLVKPQKDDNNGVLPHSPFWRIPPLTAPIMGRDQDVQDVCALLKRPDVRLVTLFGTGGVGKTSLAQRVALTMESDFPDGGCFVSLDAVTDPALVLPTCAKALGLEESKSLSVFGQLMATLHDKQFLLVLDNFEQVKLGARDIAELLAACPGLKILVTSRAVLHLPVEHEFSVQPLALPDLARQQTLEELLHSPSVTLFMHRLTAILPKFPMTEDNVRTIGEICIHLDGLPLAIELAVPRIKVLSPQRLLDRLPQGLHTFKSVLQTLPERQKALDVSMTWSYDLLDADEKWLFRRLSVFLSGGTLDTLEELFPQRSDQLLDVSSTLSSLLDQSMVQREEANGEGRFTMLETVRYYGLECLHQERELEWVQRAHAQHYLALAEKAQTYLKGPQQAEWLMILDPEWGNLRTAMQWFIEYKDGENALRFCEAFGKFCGLRGYWSEERHTLQVVLDLPEASAPTAIRARVLRRAGHLAYRLRDLSKAHTWFAESVQLSRQFGDQYNLVGALGGLGRVQYRENDIYAAANSLEEGVLVARACRDEWALANALETLGSFIYDQGDVVKARTLLEESISLLRELGDKESLSRSLRTLVLIELASDHVVQADLLANESFQLAKELGTEPLIALALDSLVDVALFRGQYERAKTLVEERIALAQTLVDTATVLKKRLILGEIAVEQEDPLEMVDLVQASLRFFRQQGDHSNMAVALGILGDIELAREDFLQAKIFYKECFDIYVKTGNKTTVARHLIRQAKVCKKRSLVEGVVNILRVAEVWQNPLPSALWNEYDKLLEWLQSELDETEFKEMLSPERALTLEELLDLLKTDTPGEYVGP